MKNRNRQDRFVRASKKFLLSAFVVISFAAYALENHTTAAGRVTQVAGGAIPTPSGAAMTAAGTPTDTATASAAAAPTAGVAATDTATSDGAAPTAGVAATGTATSDGAAPTGGVAATGTATSSAPAAPTAEVTATSAATSTPSSGYKDGTYTGPVLDVNWGYVQVQATIQSGQISNVQFLQFPSDRRTSQRINSIANPELEQEAIQAQSANVDIITGATLTSEGFQQSLQAALNQAKG
jgi:uncharacterized protein with FMN-binding domain